MQVPGAFGLSAPPFFTYGFCLAVRQSCNSSGHHFHIPDRKQEGERWEQKGYHKPQAASRKPSDPFCRALLEATPNSVYLIGHPWLQRSLGNAVFYLCALPPIIK